MKVASIVNVGLSRWLDDVADGRITVWRNPHPLPEQSREMEAAHVRNPREIVEIDYGVRRNILQRAL